MAVSGLDMALWDAFAKRSGVTVAEALGARPKPIPAYDSYGVVDPKADVRAGAQGLRRARFPGDKIKLGDGDLASDLACLTGVREVIGPDIGLMVDYNQALDVRRRSIGCARWSPSA